MCSGLIMKVLLINSVPYGSTGRIVFELYKKLKENGHQAKMAFGYSYHPIKQLKGKYIKIGNPLDKKLHNTLTLFKGYHGVYSVRATRKLIKQIKEYKPDVLHLHNLHSGYINIPLLFEYIKQSRIKVVWTLHDCWAFTGKCPHYTFVGCNKWKQECRECSQLSQYPKSLKDRTTENFYLKKEWFLGVKDLTLVTPSEWLYKEVKQSFLKDYKTVVINNGIDLSVFKRAEVKDKIKNAPKNKTVLAVSYGWNDRKGFSDLIKVADKLGSDYQVIIVGTDKNNQKYLTTNVLEVKRTDGREKLIELYSLADVFFNPTKEDTFPTVNIEALACGTPIVTYDTGGSVEIINSSCGIVVKNGDVDNAVKQIERICEEKPYSVEDCIKRSQDFNKEEKFSEYIRLYESN